MPARGLARLWGRQAPFRGDLGIGDLDPGEGRMCCVRAGARAEPQDSADSAFLRASAAFERLERGARSRQDSHLLETQIFLLRNAPALPSAADLFPLSICLF